MSIQKKHPANFDLAVLLIFFSRTETFKEVFNAVKEARPARLYLACDGPREGRQDDYEGIAACKKIAEDIDWECEVYTNYAETNMGCGMRPQTAIKWVFENEECAVVLEDDCVPHAAFFPYMSEMLQRYKDDTRICIVSAFNHFSNWDCDKYSYFFTRVGPLGGAWGSWKRVWEKYDYCLEKIKDPYLQRLMRGDITHKRARRNKVKEFIRTNKRLTSGENISYWDVQFSYLKYTQSFLSIVPKFSLASNIGLGAGATHGKDCISNPMPSIFFAPEKVLEFPVCHPDFVICDHKYDDMVDEKWGYPNSLLRNFCRGVRFLKRILRLR